MLNEGEFETAYFAAKDRYPKLSRERSHFVVKTMNERWRANQNKASYEQMSFRDLITVALKFCQVFGESDREMYKAVIGSYFGARGQKARQHQPKKQKIAEQDRPRLPAGVNMSKTGQLGWDF